MNYLTMRFKRGDKYNTLNLQRSAISAFHSPIGNVKVGQHLAVTQIMGAFFNARPPLPRYEVTWDVDQVLTHLVSLGANKHMALKQLTLKLAMLLALASAGRSSDLRAFDINFMKLEEDKVIFSLGQLTKSRRRGKPPILIEFSRFEDNPLLCVLSTLSVYLDRTKLIRERGDKTQKSQLLLSFVEPHRAVVPCTIAGWLLKIMSVAGIDTNEFRAHSTRGASTSKADAKGLSCKEILDMAKWKKESTFYKHYRKQIAEKAASSLSNFGNIVLSG